METNNDQNAKQRCWLLIAYLLFIHMMAVCLGVTAAVYDGNRSLLSFAISWAVAVVVTLACRDDAIRRGHPLSHGAELLMLFTWVVAAPLYLVWSRGLRGVLWAMLWTATFVTCAVAPMLVVEAILAA